MPLISLPGLTVEYEVDVAVTDNTVKVDLTGKAFGDAVATIILLLVSGGKPVKTEYLLMNEKNKEFSKTVEAKVFGETYYRESVRMRDGKVFLPELYTKPPAYPVSGRIDLAKKTITFKCIETGRRKISVRLVILWKSDSVWYRRVVEIYSKEVEETLPRSTDVKLVADSEEYTVKYLLARYSRTFNTAVYVPATSELTVKTRAGDLIKDFRIYIGKKKVVSGRELRISYRIDYTKPIDVHKGYSIRITLYANGNKIHSETYTAGGLGQLLSDTFKVYGKGRYEIVARAELLRNGRVIDEAVSNREQITVIEEEKVTIKIYRSTYEKIKELMKKYSVETVDELIDRIYGELAG